MDKADYLSCTLIYHKWEWCCWVQIGGDKCLDCCIDLCLFDERVFVCGTDGGVISDDVVIFIFFFFEDAVNVTFIISNMYLKYKIKSSS